MVSPKSNPETLLMSRYMRSNDVTRGGLWSSSVADFAAGHELGGEVVVVGASVVMSAERHCVLEVGVAAVAPGVQVMDVAPGVGAFVALAAHEW